MQLRKVQRTLARLVLDRPTGAAALATTTIRPRLLRTRRHIALYACRPIGSERVPTVRPFATKRGCSILAPFHPIDQLAPLHTRTMTGASTSTMAQISLTPLEDALCQLLNDTCRWIETKKPQPDVVESGGTTIEYHDGWTCEARIAGGWVRDKLLGLASHDLDVALSSLTGHVFALLLREYLISSDFAQSSVAQAPGSPFSAGSSTSTQLVGHITKIAANPEQSKNLETATAVVAGLQLDFVNLRKEVYIGSSRIPTMTFGTPLEDAERRDITINALFYNVQTRQVEDLTGMGLADMRQKVIRTPLEPQQTFLDDPLRVLRCVRFASRFGYTVHHDVMRCLVSSEQGPEIGEALKTKVSRERFGMEIEKMMMGPNPEGAIDLIESMGLFEIVFGPLPGEQIRGTPTTHRSASKKAVRLIGQLWQEAEERKGRGAVNGKEAAQAWTGRVQDKVLAPILDREARRFLYYSAALLPLQNQEWEEKKNKWFWAGECVVAKGLKLGVKNAREPLSSLHRSAEILMMPVAAIFDHNAPEYRGSLVPNLEGAPISARSIRALLMRLPDVHKPEIGVHAPLSILWALISDMARAADRKGSNNVELADPYIALVAQLEAEGILDRLDEKPLLDGKETCELLQMRPGPKMAVVLKRVEAWQFDRDAPAGPGEHARLKDECKAWLKNEWDNGGIVALDQRDGNAPAPPKKKNKQVNQK